MFGKSLYKDIRTMEAWKKNAISILFFLFFGFLIYISTELVNNGYPLFLLFLPLIVTSGFYVKKWNLSPSIFSTLSLFFLSFLHYGQEFFEFWYISFLNLTIFFILFSVVSILIGRVNIYFEELKDEKKSEMKNRKKAEKRSDFLTTLLRQDLLTKLQIIQGYLQLLENSKLTEKQNEYLEKSLEKGKEADKILKMIKNLKEIEKKDWEGERGLSFILDEAVKQVLNLADRKKVRIKKGCPENVGKVKGYYPLKTLFSRIFETQIKFSDCEKIKISCKSKRKNLLIKIEDDGKKLSESSRELLSSKTYKGYTAGEGGLRYYIIKKIAEQTNCQIDIEDSALGGNRFEIRVPKASFT